MESLSQSKAPVEKRDWSPIASGLIFVSAALFVFFQLVLQTFPSVMREGLVVDLSLSGAGFGGLSSSFYYPYILLQVPAGILVALFGPRAVLAAGAGICTVAIFLFLLSETALSAELTRVLMGLGAGPTVVCAMTLAARWFPVRLFPAMVALTEMSGMAGAALGQEVLGLIVEMAGWRAGMAACGVFSLILFLLILLLVKDRPDQAIGVEDKEAEKPTLREILLLLLSPSILLRCAAGGLVSTAGVAFAMLWGVPYFEHYLAMSLPAASLCASFYFWGCLPGMLFFGWACPRLAKPVTLLALGSVGTGLSMGAILFGLHDYALLCAAMFLLGVCDSSYALAFTMVQSKAPTSLTGIALGLTNMMIMGIGGLLFQPLIGLIAQWRGLEVPDAAALSIIVWAQPLALTILVLVASEDRRNGEHGRSQSGCQRGRDMEKQKPTVADHSQFRALRLKSSITNTYLSRLAERVRAALFPPPEPPHLALGRAGEKLAAKHLRSNGHKILYRNFRATHGGEIDIVCRDKRHNELVFVEVKTRSSEDFGRPLDAVDRKKRRLILRGAMTWLKMLDMPDIVFRFDVVEVVMSGPAVIRHIENAFRMPDDYSY